MPDIFSPEEIWRVQKDFYEIDGFKFYCNTRINGQEGGAGLYINESFNSSVLKNESLFVENILIYCNKNRNLSLKIQYDNIINYKC